MFLIRWGRAILSLPLRVLGWPLFFVCKPVGRELLKAVWPVTRFPKDGAFALQMVVTQQGPAVAIETGLAWAQRWPSAHLWAMVGAMALDNKQLKLAGQCLQQAQAYPPDAEGLVDILDFHLQMRSTPPGEFVPEETMQRFLQRRDLPPHLGKSLELEQLWKAILLRQFELAQQHAQKILEIESAPSAHMAMGLIHAINGQTDQSRRHFSQAVFPGPKGPSLRLYYETVVNAAMGNAQAGRDCFVRLQTALPDDARNVKPHLEQLMPGMLQGIEDEEPDILTLIDDNSEGGQL